MQVNKQLMIPGTETVAATGSVIVTETVTVIIQTARIVERHGNAPGVEGTVNVTIGIVAGRKGEFYLCHS